MATGSALTWNGSVFDVRGSTYIGNGSSSYYLDIGSDANNSYVRSSNQSTSFFVGTRTSIPLRFLINDSEVARFNTSGYLGIGTSSPAGKLSVTNAGGAGNYNFYTNATNIANPNSSGSEIIGSQITVGGNIILSERQPNGAYSDRTDLAFVTNTGYGIGQSEKMRLDSSGNLLSLIHI